MLFKYYKSIDKIVALTEWHKNALIGNYKPLTNEKFTKINNGIITSGYTDSLEFTNKKIKNSFVFTSKPDRGLDRILEIWPAILEKMPDATLNVAIYGKFPESPVEVEIETQMKKYNNIRYLGQLNERELRELLSVSEYWLYPNWRTETSCITAMEMLLCEVICIYFPLNGLTGLNDTLGPYGITSEKGKELETILNITEEQKLNFRKKGKEYALTCSWKHRANQWMNLMTYTYKKIGIFNSFNFHYEVFGFILDYAIKNDYYVDIYTNIVNDLGWFEFYKDTFQNFTLYDYKLLSENDIYTYELFILPTDDDPLFKNEWKKNNVICINHLNIIRNPNFEYYINIGNFKDSNLEYIYPCYNILKVSDKIIDTDYINIASIGGGLGININIINRLKTNTNKKIKLFIFMRSFRYFDINLINNDIEVIYIPDITTKDMINILRSVSYILITNQDDIRYYNAIAIPGSVQIAYSTLCKPIICTLTNQYLDLKNAITFDLYSSDSIILNDDIDYNLINFTKQNYITKRNIILDSIYYHKYK
jgi:hypothetical protein